MKQRTQKLSASCSSITLTIHAWPISLRGWYNWNCRLFLVIREEC